MVTRKEPKSGYSAPWSALTAAAVASALVGLCAPRLAAQDDLDKAIEKLAADNKKLAKKQEKIEDITQETASLLDRYRGVQKRMAALRTYNGQLSTLVASQKKELDTLREQIDLVTVVGRQITPLMLRMIDSLDQFVELDIPFLLDERRARVKDLRVLMNRSDVADSEKFRRLMEAYQIENEYGRTIEAYRGTLQDSGKTRTVDYLRVGRIVLVYQTLDGKEAGRWDADAGAWKPLSDVEKSSIPGALRIARKQAAPNLIRMPVPAPEAAK